jgi:DNA-binding response OmpR family regulator
MKKILIVEDTISIRESISDILKMEDYKVSEAENGEIGYQLAIKELPDLIISDILMPVKDGYKLFSDLKSNPKTENIPFVFLSSKTDKSDIRTGMNLGADDYLTKPISIDDLLKVISKKIEIHERNRQKIEILKNEITLSIPHELKTPLNSIQGFAELMKNKNSEYSIEQFREMAGYIYAGALRLDKLIEKYILFTGLIINKIQKQDLFSKNKNLDVKNKITEISVEIAKNADRISDLQIISEDFKYPFDEKYFSLLVFEPVENAFKFSKAGNKVKILSFIKDSSFHLQIENEGSTMSEQQVTNIGAFSQFNRNLNEQQGVGLGLALLKGFVELLEGKLLIESDNKSRVTIKTEIPINHNFI